MRILWASNYSSQSGYSIQARLFVPRIHAAGHPVTVFELANGQRLPAKRDGIAILPVHLDPLGSDVMLKHVEQANAHAVITLTDVWALNPEVMGRINWFPYTPVDTYPLAPRIKQHLQSARFAIAMSRYGQQQLQAAGVEALYMPHGIDPAIWHPRDKAQARRELGIASDTFFVSFVGVNDSNPSRKGIPEMLMAWQIFSETHPDATLYLHTTQRGRLALGNTSGVDIPHVLDTFAIDPASVRFADEYAVATAFSPHKMAQLAAAADVLLLPTRGEGFGLPVLEYAAVGTPAIVTNFATSPELCFDGWLLEYEPEWSWQNALVAKPGLQAIVEALDAAYADRDNPRRQAACIEGARAYHIDHVFAQYTLPVIEKMADVVLDNVSVGA